MNTVSNKITTKIKGYAKKIKEEIFLIYLFPLVSTLVYYIYMLISVNFEDSTYNFEITNIKFISFIVTVLGLYGFTCFQCKTFFTILSSIFCSIIWWLLNFPFTNSYINSSDQQIPNWNLLIFLQILYLILIFGLFFLLRLISKNQTSKMHNGFIYRINKTSHTQKILLLLLLIIIIVFLFLISSNPSFFQIIIIIIEAIIGMFFVYFEKKHFSPHTVDFTKLSLETTVTDDDNYKVIFRFVNDNININDCYKIITSNIKVEFTSIDETKVFSFNQETINKNKINNNRLVFEIYESFNQQDYNKFINKSFYPTKRPQLKLSFNYKVVHEKSEENIFYKLNNSYLRTQECVFISTGNSDIYTTNITI